MHRLVYFLTTLFLSVGLMAEQKIVAAYPEEVPNTISFKKNKYSGAMGRLMSCVVEQSELELKPVAMGSEQLLDELAQGKVDVAIALLKSDERNVFATPTSAIVTLDAVLLSKSPVLAQDLKGQVIAVSRGSSFASQLSDSGARLKFTESYVGALQALIEGDVTGAALPRSVINANGISEAERFHSLVFNKDELVFYVSAKSEQHDALVKQLNRGLNFCQAK